MSLSARFQLNRSRFSLDVDFDIPDTGISVLFGPSGCGKSTLLRCMAGLEQAYGTLHVKNICWQNSDNKLFIPTHRRGIGVVFQDPALFSHLNVRQNLAYAAKRSAAGKSELENISQLLKLDGLLERDTVSLSGGEKQRVAIARALLSQPELLLMDEPLAALDVERKNEILPYLDQLNRRLNIGIVYVTHNIDELLTLADYLLIMNNGRMLAHGRPAQLLSRLDLPLAQRDDACSIIACNVLNHEANYNLTRLQLGDQVLVIPRIGAAPQQQIRLRIQARDVSLCRDKPERSSILNILPATVMELGKPTANGQQIIRLSVAGETVLARISVLSSERLELTPGIKTFAQIKSVALSR